ncbi:MAG TPA: hypothetical protein VKR54_04425 [Candidatus Babeliales bacterium]|jgi:hypothetical protein|nr:hypothetical protein [Candidatus Babeliales bacterium]
MKKNILIVQALLLLPLMISSLLLGMEKTPSRRNRQKKNNNKLMIYLKEQTETQEQTPQATLQEQTALQNQQNPITKYHTIPTEATDSDESYSSPFTDSQELVPHNVQQQIINKSTEEEPTIAPDVLLQSVILPTETKGLNFFDTIFYYTGNPTTNIISLLKNKTFKTDNNSYFEWLNEAIKTAVKNNDFDALATIATLCQAEEYKKTIRIPDEVAQPAVALCSTKYITELSLVNKAIENNRQNNIAQYNIKTLAFTKALNDMINTHKQDLQNIADDHNKSIIKETARIANMQEQINNFAHLNKSIRETTTNLLTTNAIEIPKDKFNKKFNASTERLNNLTTIGTSMPQIKIPQNVLVNSLAIDNK